MLHFETITAETLSLLMELQKLPVLSNARLVGGTALALQIGHRQSVDLDFFGDIQADTETLRLSYGIVGHVETLSVSKNINVFRISGIKVDTVNYRYPWIEPLRTESGIRLASVQDIAAMKVAAIINRGTKKDFIDLFFLLKIFSLNEILSLYEQKYDDASLFIALKSISYFDDAESDPMPVMLDAVTWAEVKESIISCLNG